MISFLKKNKGYFLIVGMMLFFGAIFLVVSLVYEGSSKDVRNSTDNIAKKVKLEETHFRGDKLPSNWSKSENLLIMNEVALFNESDLSIRTPLLNSTFTKYFEISVCEINYPIDGEFLVRGYDSKKNALLEEISIEVRETNLYTHRFSYDHVFIDQIEFLYIGQETSISVAYLGVFSLQ